MTAMWAVLIKAGEDSSFEKKNVFNLLCDLFVGLPPGPQGGPPPPGHPSAGPPPPQSGPLQGHPASAGPPPGSVVPPGVPVSGPPGQPAPHVNPAFFPPGSQAPQTMTQSAPQVSGTLLSESIIYNYYIWHVGKSTCK